jgi:hypothetical protein
MMTNRLIVVTTAAVSLASGGVILSGCDEFPEYVEPAAPPPADAEYLPEDFDSANELANAAGGDLEAYSANFADLWIPDTGWQGEVSAVRDEGDGVYSVRMFVQSSRLGGGYWIIAMVPGLAGGQYSGLKKEDYITFQGQIDRIDAIQEPASPPLPRIIVKNARILKARGY